MYRALKYAVAVGILSFAAVGFAQVTVTVTSPSNGATVTSPMTLKAWASGSTGITGWYVYVDNSAAWHTSGPTASISPSISLSKGTHSVHVRAWQSNGAYGDRYLTVTAGSTSTSTSGVNVSLKSPTGGTVSSTFTVSASASSPNGISGWAVYADNNKLWSGDTYSNSFSKSFSLGGGSHSLYVRAWDKGGAGYGTSSTAQITVGSGTNTSSTSALPSVPSYAKVFTKLEDTSSDWSACSNCAGGNSTSNYWSAPYQGSPSRDGSSREFFNGGGPWANVLWIKKLGNQNSYHHFLWDFWVNFNSTAASSLWTAEYDLWQSVSGHEFMIGSQCNFGTGYWDTWNSASNHWVQTWVPCPRFSGNSWHHIQWYMERISSNQYRYDTLVVDGKAYKLNQVFYTNPVNWADAMGVQWQLDLGSNGYDAHEWIDQVKLSIW